MKKTLLAATVLAAMMTVPAAAGTLGTVVTPTVIPPAPPPPGGMSPLVYVLPGVLLVCALACNNGDAAPATPVTPGT